jgi:hypothetical protein
MASEAAVAATEPAVTATEAAATATEARAEAAPMTPAAATVIATPRADWRPQQRGCQQLRKERR